MQEEEEDVYDFDELYDDLKNLDIMRTLIEPDHHPQLILTKDGGYAYELPLSWYFELSDHIRDLAIKEKERLENKLNKQLNKKLKIIPTNFVYDEEVTENRIRIINSKLPKTWKEDLVERIKIQKGENNNA